MTYKFLFVEGEIVDGDAFYHLKLDYAAHSQDSFSQFLVNFWLQPVAK
jgi:hypothetical protein